MNTLRKFFKFADTTNRKRFYGSIVLGIFEALLQAMKMPAIYLIVKGVVSNSLGTGTILAATGILVGSIALQIFISCFSKMAQTRGGYETCADKRIEIANHLRYAPMGFFNKNSLGYITSVTTNTMENLSDVATRVVMLVTQGVFEAALINLVLYVFDWRIGLVATAGIVFFFLANFFLQRKAQKLAPRKMAADSEIVQKTMEFIGGIAEAKSYGISAENDKELSDAIDEASAINTDMELSFTPYMGLQSWLVKMTGVAMCALSLLFCIGGSMGVAECAVMLIASFMVFAALDTAGMFSALLRVVDASVDKANEVLSIPNMDIDGKDIPVASHDIEMKNVSFAYEDRKIVNDVSLSVPSGSTVAFVGPSGGGKTTICHLISRFWDVDEGSVTLDGKDVREYSMDSLMKNFSFVFQSVYLFHDTIANNIRFGSPDTPMEKVIEAAKKACCHDFISSLPNGYDTVIGEGGSSLSGGEKQRISIARAILKDSPIIILDEATANVDPENEHDLIAAIKELTKHKTVLMIAHRLNTVRHADKIFVIDQGRIAEEGTHDELMKKDGIYRRFIDARVEAVSWKIS